MKLETDLGFTVAYYILIGICINLDCFILSCYVFRVFNACYMQMNENSCDPELNLPSFTIP